MTRWVLLFVAGLFVSVLVVAALDGPKWAGMLAFLIVWSKALDDV